MSSPLPEQTWCHMTEEIMSGRRTWRAQHPIATLREMEDELDARWTRVRARMLEDMAAASTAADWADAPAGSIRPVPTAARPYSCAERSRARSRPTAGSSSP